MASIAINIAEEFLRSPNPQIRKNSLAALAVVNEEESARLIAETALTDDDWTVRQRAKIELQYRLAATIPVIPAAVEDLLVSALKSDDPSKQKRANAILGQLKSRGFHVPQVRMKLGTRMWLASTLYFSHYPDRNWSFRLRMWRPGLIGTLVGAIPLLIYVRQYITSPSMYLFAVTLLMVGFSLLGTLISLFATQFLTPISMHLRRVSSSVVQIMVTFLNVLGGMLILQMILVFARISYYALIDWFGAFILIASLVAAVTRFGTILTFGRFKFLNKRHVRTRNFIVQTLGGIILAFVVATVIYFLAMLKWRYSNDDFTVLWLSSLAIAMGLAAAFASIDSEAPPVEGNIIEKTNP